MAAPALARPPESPPAAQPRLFLVGEEPVAAAATGTLESVVSEAWDALKSGRGTACVLCGGLMAPRWSAGAGVVGGRCTDCGTALD